MARHDTMTHSDARFRIPKRYKLPRDARAWWWMPILASFSVIVS